jgi:beta-adrenergic-receptor kinase
MKKQGGPFGAAWHTRYAKLYPNRLELYSDSNKPELTFMDQIEEIHSDLIQIKNEPCIVLKTKEGKVVLTNPDEIGLKEWSISLRNALKCSHELLSGLKKAGKIYGTSDGTNSAN